MRSTFNFILSMIIFGTVGIFVHYIPLPSSVIAFCRGFIGVIFLLVAIKIKGISISKQSIKNNLPILIISGAALGGNWVLLFEAYRHTSIATATLCYYLAPIIVVLLSPFVLKERLTMKKGLCVAVALLGMIFVSGVLQGKREDIKIEGLLFGIGAACLYATVVLLNKKTPDVPSFDKTFFGLGVSAAVTLPYALLTEWGTITTLDINYKQITLLVLVGVLHTGIAYLLYFGSIKNIKAQSVACFSYIDPALAVVLSALLLKTTLSVYEIIGAVLIIGGAMFSELNFKKGNYEYEEDTCTYSGCADDCCSLCRLRPQGNS